MSLNWQVGCFRNYCLRGRYAEASNNRTPSTRKMRSLNTLNSKPGAKWYKENLNSFVLPFSRGEFLLGQKRVFFLLRNQTPVYPPRMSSDKPSVCFTQGNKKSSSLFPSDKKKARLLNTKIFKLKAKEMQLVWEVRKISEDLASAPSCDYYRMHKPKAKFRK